MLADEILPEGHRKDRPSAFRSFARGLGQPLKVISSDPVELRRLLRDVTPAMAGFRNGGWRNGLSLLTSALTHLGVIVVQGRIASARSAEWLAILGQLEPGQERHFHSRRFARYCTVRGILPTPADDTVLETYLSDLECRSLVAEPARATREVARLWNAAADQAPARPQCRLTMPKAAAPSTIDHTAWFGHSHGCPSGAPGCWLLASQPQPTDSAPEGQPP